MDIHKLLDDPKVIPSSFSLLEAPSTAGYHNQWFSATFENMRQMLALESSAVQQTLELISPINATQNHFNNLSAIRSPVPFLLNGFVAPRIPDNYDTLTSKQKKKVKIGRSQLIKHSNIHKSLLYPKFFLKPLSITIPRLLFQQAKFQYNDRLTSLSSAHSSMSLWYRERCIHSFYVSGSHNAEFHPHLGCYVIQMGKYCVCYSLDSNKIAIYSEPIRQFILPPRFSITIVLTDKAMSILSLPDLKHIRSVPISPQTNVSKITLKSLSTVPCFIFIDQATNTTDIYSVRALRKLISLDATTLPEIFDIVPTETN